jgi:hypothetical protein
MPVNVQRPGPPRRAPLLFRVVAAVGLLSLSACEDDSPVTRDPGTSQPDTGGTQVDEVSGGDGTGTVLPRDTSPGATDAPNPYAGGGGAETGTTSP